MKNQITMMDVAADRVNHAYRYIGGGITALLYDDNDTSQDAEYTATLDGQYIVEQGADKKSITETEFNNAFAQCPYFFEYDEATEEYKTIARDPAEEPHPFYYPACRFCRQIILPDRESATQEDADEWATMQCKCNNAREYQREQERIADRKRNIERINGTIDYYKGYCDRRGATLTDEAREILFSSAVSVLDDVITGAVVQFGSRMKIKINKNSKGAVSFTFNYADSVKAEV